MKKFTLNMMLLAFAVTLNLSTKAQVTFNWSHTYDGGNTDRALVVNPEDPNFIHVAGTTEKAAGLKIYTEKYKANGTPLWSRTGNTLLTGDVLFMKRDASLNTFVVCVNASITGYTIIKYNVNAKELWRKNFLERPVGLEIDALGKVYTAGQAPGGFYARSYRNSDGFVLWARSETDGIYAAAFDIDNSGNVYVGGNNRINDSEIRIVKFGISSTTPIWATNFQDADGFYDDVSVLAVDNAANVFIGGGVNAGTLIGELAVAKFNSSGVFQWETNVIHSGGFNSSSFVSLLIDPSQNPIVVGQTNDFYNVSPDNETSRIFAVKLNRSTGVEIYNETPNDPSYSNPTIDESPECASVDQYGHVYVGGTSNAGGDITERHWSVTKINAADGSSTWTQSGSSSTGENRTNNIYINASGKVYLANTELGSTPDFQIVKLSQAGGGARETIDELQQNFAPESYIIYPNPSAEKFTLDFPSTGEAVDVSVIDISGRIVNEYKNISSPLEFGSELKKGVYFVNLLSGGNKQTVKIVKVTE
jgi:hypothetical protein